MAWVYLHFACRKCKESLALRGGIGLLLASSVALLVSPSHIVANMPKNTLFDFFDFFIAAFQNTEVGIKVLILLACTIILWTFLETSTRLFTARAATR